MLILGLLVAWLFACVAAYLGWLMIDIKRNGL